MKRAPLGLLAGVHALLLGACGTTATTTDGTADTGGADITFKLDTTGADATTGDDTTASDTTASDTATTDASTSDTATGGGNPVTQLGACLGTPQALTVSALMPYATSAIGPNSEASGAFVLDFSSTFSSIDLKAFTTAPATSGCDTSVLGGTCVVPDFHVFGAVYKASLVLEDFSGLTGPLRQAGIIGTDFLSLHVITLAFGSNQVFASPTTGAFCDDAAMKQAGMVALSTSGYFEHDLTKLKLYTTVDSTATPGGHVPNVPTVPVRVAGVSALAQLDTGYSDALVTHSVNINKAFLAALQKDNPTALVRDATLDTKLTTCLFGVQEDAQAYHLASGQTFELIGLDGTTAGSWADATIFVKQTPVDAKNCGGIGTWAVPAAQVGASFYGTLGTVVFDPFGAKVWIPKP